MKRIATSNKLLNVSPNATLADLKLTYRSLIKQYHPDKVIDDDAKKAEFEELSRKIIEAYHFIVSIHKETHEANKEAYLQLINQTNISGIDYKGSNVIIDFEDGSSYEYLGVPKNVYVKLMQAPKLARFARRHLYESYIYRNTSKTNVPK